MADVVIVGGGPAGLSAGLFTGKNGLDTTILDADESWMHNAHLYNYLGIRSIGGDVFLERARNQVIDDYGAELELGVEVTEASETGDGFEVVTDEGEEYRGDYLILATGANRGLAEDLGCEFDGDVVDVDVTMETSVADCYATGAMVREEEWQAIISAGDGGAAALNILSKEEGEQFHDFDTPDDV